MTTYQPLTAYEITCENGYTWRTSMAAHVTIEMSKKYFIGNRFNTAAYPGENFSKAVKVIKLK